MELFFFFLYGRHMSVNQNEGKTRNELRHLSFPLCFLKFTKNSANYYSFSMSIYSRFMVSVMMRSKWTNCA